MPNAVPWPNPVSERTSCASARAMLIHPSHRLIAGLSLRGWLLASGLLLLGGCAQFPYPELTGSEQPTEAEATDDADGQTEEAATAQTIPEPQEDPEPGKLYEWSKGASKISHVVIDTNEQRARFYNGREQVGWTTIASGVSSHPTPSGEFEVMEKVAKKRSNLYGRIYNAGGGVHKRSAHSRDPIPAGGKFVGARMPYFMRMTYDGIGMHAGPIPRPGQPASHGCIRLPPEVASSLFSKVDIGTRVTVVGNGPSYGNYAERIRREREQERLNRIAAAEEAANEPSQEERPARQRQDGSAGESTDARGRSRQRDQRRPSAGERANDSSPASSPSPSVNDSSASQKTEASDATEPEPGSASSASSSSSSGTQASSSPSPASEQKPEQRSEAPRSEPAPADRTPTPVPPSSPAVISPTPAEPEAAPAPTQPPTPVTPPPSAPRPAASEATAAVAAPESLGDRGARDSENEAGDQGSRTPGPAPVPQQTAPRRTTPAAEPEVRAADRDQRQEPGA